MKDYRKIKSNLIFKGKVIDVVEDIVILPNKKEVKREIVKHKGASAILAIDKNGDIIFIRQYRYAIEKHILELPAGCLEKFEDPKMCAIRELEEEVGYKTENIKLIGKFYTSAGFCNEIIYIYLAKNLKKSRQFLDEDEIISIEKHSLNKSIDMISKGEIVDGKTIIGILFYQNILNNNSIQN